MKRFNMKRFNNALMGKWLPIVLPVLALPTAFIGLSAASAALRSLNTPSVVNPSSQEELRIAQAPASLSDRPTVAQVPFPADSRQVRRAERDLQRAREEAFSVQFLSQQATSSEAGEVTAIAQSVLEQAERSYQEGRFFEAEKEAKAAKAIYEAAETLYESELGYVVSSSGRPRGPSRSYFDAPHRAQERIARAEAEMDFYQQSDARVSDLISRARLLADTSGAVAPVQNLTPVQNPATIDLAYLARNRAAYQLARGATYLMEAARGF